MSLKEFLNVFQVFIFHQLIKILLLKKFKIQIKLKSNKAVEDTDIPIKILKDNTEFFFGVYLSSI